MNYLEFYKKCMETGRIPYAGLCNCIPSEEDKLIIKPTRDDLYEVEREGYSTIFWGSGVINTIESDPQLKVEEESQGFTPLRQNLVLLLAAEKNQL